MLQQCKQMFALDQEWSFSSCCTLGEVMKSLKQDWTQSFQMDIICSCFINFYRTNPCHPTWSCAGLYNVASGLEYNVLFAVLGSILNVQKNSGWQWIKVAFKSISQRFCFVDLCVLCQLWLYMCWYLTFKWLGQYLNFAHGLWKLQALFEQKKILLCNKRHFVENKTEIVQGVLKMQ